MSTMQPLHSPPQSGSETCGALRLALLGAEQAQRLYLHAAHRLAADALQVIAHAFRFTAAQEGEHAAVLRGLLCACGGSIPAAADDAPLPREPLSLLRTVRRMEQERSGALLPACARAALAEGQPRVARACQRMAETEARHARRFAQYAAALEEGTLFRAEERVSWFCLGCGQLHTGFEPPETCAACGGQRGHFIRTDFYPFSVEG